MNAFISNQKKHKATYKRMFFISLVCLSLGLISLSANATTQTLGSLATNITKSFESLTRLITATAYIGGVGFFIASIFKFKQHKDSPQQTTIGAPIALLFIAAALLFLPSIVETTGQTIFGNTPTVAGPTGVILGTAS